MVNQAFASKQIVSNIQGFGNRLPQLPEDYFEKSTFRRVLKFEFKSCNRLPLMCNRLPATELLKFNLKSYDPSKHNCVIDYQWRISEKTFWKDTFLQTILKRHKGPIYMCVWLQKARERYSKRTSLPNAISTTLGQTFANFSLLEMIIQFEVPGWILNRFASVCLRVVERIFGN